MGQQLDRQKPTTQHVTLQISGMTCASCVSHVEQALRELPGEEVNPYGTPSTWKRLRNGTKLAKVVMAGRLFGFARCSRGYLGVQGAPKHGVVRRALFALSAGASLPDAERRAQTLMARRQICRGVIWC